MADQSRKNKDVTSNTGRIRSFAKGAFFWVGVAATILGVIEGSGYIREQWDKWSKEKIERTPLVSSKQHIILNADHPMTEISVVADTIEVDGGTHVVPDGSVWLANRVSLRDGAILKSRHVAIIASSLEGGQIDVSGETAKTPAAHGGDGGDIFLAVGHLSNVRLIARGADGAAGGAGLAGANGRDGSCSGFGGYRGADPGKDGQQGSAGGKGGSGGRIRVVSTDVSPVPAPVDLSRGRGGAGGSGGNGGRGGTGCVGLGGSQTGQPAGNAGPKGVDGESGDRDGNYEPRSVNYKSLLDIVRKSSDESTPDPSAVLKSLVIRFYNNVPGS